MTSRGGMKMRQKKEHIFPAFICWDFRSGQRLIMISRNDEHRPLARFGATVAMAPDCSAASWIKGWKLMRGWPSRSKKLFFLLWERSAAHLRKLLHRFGGFEES